MTAANPLSLLTVEFRDAAMEQAFQEKIWPERSRQNRIAATAWIVLALLQIGWNFSRVESIEIALLVVQVALGFIFWLVCKRHDFKPSSEWVVTGVIVAALVTQTFGILLQTSSSDLSTASFVIAPLILAVGLHLRTLTLGFGCVAAVGGYLIVVTPRTEYADLNELLRLQILVTTAMGLVVHRLINSSRRLSFLELRHQAELNARLDAASAAKSRFLAHISHEIRTPMNGVLGVADLLLKEKELPDGFRPRLGMIRESAQALLSLLHDLLDFAAIEAGRLPLVNQPFSLAITLRHCLDLIRPTAAEKGLHLAEEFDPACPDWVVGDGSRLRQVLLNLLSNAVKFTTQGTITLTVQVRAGTCHFTVTDTGSGLTAAQCVEIFEPFRRLNPHASGLGLGLSISQQLVQQMGGALTVQSSPGQGTAFSFALTLPLGQPPSLHPPVLLALRDARLLLAEDNRLNRFVAVELLKSLGFQHLDVAEDGTQALRLAQAHRYDLILLDGAMPGLNGWEVAQRLRGKDCPPLVALSAYVTAEDRQRCREAGMVDFLAKPLLEAELIEVLNRYLAPSFDLTAAQRQVGGQASVWAQTVLMAQEDLPAYLDDVAKARRQGDQTETRRLAHKLLGSLKTLHAEAAAEATREFMENSSEENETRLRKSVELLLAQLSQK